MNMNTGFLLFSLSFLFLCPVHAETLLSNLDAVGPLATSSPFANGNGKAVDFTVGGSRPFDVSDVVLRLKLTPKSRPVVQLLEKGTDAVTILSLRKRPAESETAEFSFASEKPFRLWPRQRVSPGAFDGSCGRSDALAFG